MLRKFALTTPTVLCAAVLVKKTDSEHLKNDELSLGVNKCRPSDLPIYVPLNIINKPKHVSATNEKDSVVHEYIESGVRVVRRQVQSGVNVVSSQINLLDDYIETARAHTLQTIDYLNEPQNTLPRSGAIAMGGLAGFILAARGGFIKKVLYTAIGSGAMASICYPRQAEDVSREVLLELRKVSTVTYNFVKGVKPGDNTPQETFGKFPTTVEDIKYLISDLWNDALQTIAPNKKKE